MRILQVLQNKALRLISKLGYEASTKELLEKCCELSVHQLVFYHTACQVYKIYQNRLPEYHFLRLFQNDPKSFRNKKTRYAKKGISRVDFNLSLARSSFFYQAPQVWNALPKYVKSAKNIKAFKKKLNNGQRKICWPKFRESNC